MGTGQITITYMTPRGAGVVETTANASKAEKRLRWCASRRIEAKARDEHGRIIGRACQSPDGNGVDRYGWYLESDIDC